jgi:hypothetical protein
MCAAGKCAGCGAAGQACCDGNQCYEAGQSCIAGKCGVCGMPGMPSCGGNVCPAGHCLNSDQACVAPGTMCGGMAGMCNANGSCVNGAVACGTLGQACCEIGQTNVPRFCSQSGTTCNGFGNAAKCEACGGMGQPCCENDSCAVGTCGGLPQLCR